MPLYEYQCEKCGHRFEKIEKVDAPHRQKCPKCGGRAERLLAAPAIQFKGAGWYVTDYARKDAAKGEAKEAKETKETKEEAKQTSEPAESAPKHKKKTHKED